MTDIKYYPLIDCDTEGTEKVAMIPAPTATAIRMQSKMWLEEMLPQYFRLCTQSSNRSVDTFNIRCPRCGTALKRISGEINETKRGLYVCSACTMK
jgi:hypothetical protein